MTLLGHFDFVAINTQDSSGQTALHLAATRGHAEVCHTLLAHPRFTAVDSRDCLERTPLHHAAWEGHVEACQCLLDHEAFHEPWAIDCSQLTALDCAARRGHAETCRVLTQIPGFFAASKEKGSRGVELGLHAWEHAVGEAKEVLRVALITPEKEALRVASSVPDKSAEFAKGAPSKDARNTSAGRRKDAKETEEEESVANSDSTQEAPPSSKVRQAESKAADADCCFNRSEWVRLLKLLDIGKSRSISFDEWCARGAPASLFRALNRKGKARLSKADVDWPLQYFNANKRATLDMGDLRRLAPEQSAAPPKKRPQSLGATPSRSGSAGSKARSPSGGTSPTSGPRVFVKPPKHVLSERPPKSPALVQPGVRKGTSTGTLGGRF